jgi:nucleoside-diphosphate-sugar epimerase
LKRWWPRGVKFEIAVRIIADMIMVNAALLISVILRYVWQVSASGGQAGDQNVLEVFLEAYVGTFWLLTLIGSAVFYANGFYTRGRFYAGRYKLLVMAQAVSTSYLVFALVLFLLRDLIQFPRTAIILAWALTLCFVIGSRLWIMLWMRVLQAERRLVTPEAQGNAVETVLVIGGAGYIGSVLVERLLALGYKTRVLDMLLYGDAPIRSFYEHPNFELIRGDFRHIDTVVAAVKGADAIVHLGAIVGDSACSIDPDLTIEINLQATRTIAQVGKGFGVRRFIFASTCSVYGASDEILDEHSSLQPISLYARTKVESEKVLLDLADGSFTPTILRFGTIYGFSHRPRFDLVVNLLAAKAVQEGEVGIFGGTQWRPFVHVRDVAEAIVLALRASPFSVRGETFNVGSNEQNYQISDLGPLIKEMIPEAKVVTQPKEDNRNYRVRFDKIHNVLGFRPHYTVRDGVREIIDAFASGAIQDYRDPCCSNAAYLNGSRKAAQVLADNGKKGWDWLKLSAEDALMITSITRAVFESRSDELQDRLYTGLTRAILGDVDGFLNTIADSELVPERDVPAPMPERDVPAPMPERQLAS